MTTIKRKKATYLTNGVIKGWIVLSDKTKTFFEVDRNGEWNQWGNSRENLSLTVPFMMQLMEFQMAE